MCIKYIRSSSGICNRHALIGVTTYQKGEGICVEYVYVGLGFLIGIIVFVAAGCWGFLLFGMEMGSSDGLLAEIHRLMFVVLSIRVMKLLVQSW